MNLTKIRVSEANLDFALTRSCLEFLKPNSSKSDFRLRFSIGIQEPSTEIYYHEIKDGSEVCGSFMLVYKQLQLNKSTIRVCFLTQVIVSDNYRGRGISYVISRFASSEAVSAGAGITFVIARKLVKDLYAKLGFSGFSHFSEILIEDNPDTGKSKPWDMRPCLPSDSQKLLLMYQNTYQDLDFYFVRNEESFRGLIEIPTHRIEISSDSSFYLINNQKSVVEVGMNPGVKTSEVLEFISSNGYKTIKLNAEHQVFQQAVRTGMPHSHRFEIKEGHLLKIHLENLKPKHFKYLESFIRHPGSRSAEISEMDQW